MISVWINNGYRAYRIGISGAPYFFAVLRDIRECMHKSFGILDIVANNFRHYLTLFMEGIWYI